MGSRSLPSRITENARLRLANISGDGLAEAPASSAQGEALGDNCDFHTEMAAARSILFALLRAFFFGRVAFLKQPRSLEGPIQKGEPAGGPSNGHAKSFASEQYSLATSIWESTQDPRRNGHEAYLAFRGVPLPPDGRPRHCDLFTD